MNKPYKQAYTVLHRDNAIMKPLDPPFGFVCQARNAEHAEELFLDAHPGLDEIDIVWVHDSGNYQAALHDYYNTGLRKPYAVLYYEDRVTKPGDSPLGFICMAEDHEHAEEQCLNAYPECRIVWATEGAETLDEGQEDYCRCTGGEDMSTPEFCGMAVRDSWQSLRHVPDDLKTVELCKLAVEQNKSAMRFVPDRIKNNPDFTGAKTAKPGRTKSSPGMGV